MSLNWFDALMIIDMQIWFLIPQNVKVNKLVLNTCELVDEAIKKNKKLFLVEFIWNWKIHPKIIEAIWNWRIDFCSIKKDKQHFSVFEARKGELWVNRSEFDSINSIALAWIHTNHCVRAAYQTLKDEWLDPGLFLWSTLDLHQLSSSLDWVSQYYKSFSKVDPKFIWKIQWKSSLESYL